MNSCAIALDGAALQPLTIHGSRAVSVRRLHSSIPTRTATPDLPLPLAQPITLTRGLRSHLMTLMDAAILIRDLEPFAADAARMGSDGRDDPDRGGDRGARRHR